MCANTPKTSAFVDGHEPVRTRALVPVRIHTFRFAVDPKFSWYYTEFGKALDPKSLRTWLVRIIAGHFGHTDAGIGFTLTEAQGSYVRLDGGPADNEPSWVLEIVDFDGFLTSERVQSLARRLAIEFGQKSVLLTTAVDVGRFVSSKEPVL